MKNWKALLVGGLAGVGLGVGVMLWLQSAVQPPEIAITDAANQKDATREKTPPLDSRPPTQTTSGSKPNLLQSLETERYNIVSFQGKLYGLPWGLKVDWSKPPEPGPDNGVLVDDDLAALERKIHAKRLKNPQPQLLESNERYKYNVVAFNGRLYGLPWGLEVDWSTPPEATPENGIFVGDDAEALESRIREYVAGRR